MMYESSKGAVEIATMDLSHAKNALNKLRRSEPERTDEIDALAKHVAAREAEATEAALSAASEGKTGIDKFEARAEVLNAAAERGAIGDNGGPPLEELHITGREAIDVHVADLLEQVQGCPLTIDSREQADDIGRLHRQLQQAAKLVDGTAADEKRPHNDAIAEISEWQNGYTAAKLKRTPDGKLTKALTATSNLSSGWLRKLDAERKAREAELAKAAAEKAREAIVAREEAKVSTDVEVMDRADDALAEAQALIKQAQGASKERPRAGGGDGFRAMGLRSVWSAHFSEEEGSGSLALAYYMQNPEFIADLRELILQWANRDRHNEAVRSRGVPGIIFHEEKVAA